MGFWKFLPFLVLSFLVVYQAGMFQAAPFRSALENDFDPAILTEKEMCLLLAAVMNDYVQMKTSELKQETEDLRSLTQAVEIKCTCLRLHSEENLRDCALNLEGEKAQADQKREVELKAIPLVPILVFLND
ncbi:hypothetical protein JEQ12_006051 [Ovis aries]|uniref:Calcitonin receptor-stimulating peptide 2-like n=1 Tax=Ovis aries TaxID=9940 RepID=A0A836CUJ7_SHEEP|nr:hypothetical protein JEQ12_006051 [Ovis aries]